MSTIFCFVMVIWRVISGNATDARTLSASFPLFFGFLAKQLSMQLPIGSPRCVDWTKVLISPQ